MTLGRIPTNRDIETKVATSCSQTRLAVQGREHQLTHKTFNLKFVLPTRYEGIKMEQTLREQATNDCLHLRSFPCKKATDTVNDTCRQESGITVS